MDRIQIKASELWDLLFADETAATYQQTLNLTGTIIKEFAQLVWLIICSVFVFGAWFSDTSVKAGKGIRDWLDRSNDVSVSTDPQALADKGKNLLETGRSGLVYLLNQAREQLGIEPEEMPAIERTVTTVKPAPKPTPTPQPAVSVASASQPATVKPDVKSDIKSVSEITREDDDGGWSAAQDDE